MFDCSFRSSAKSNQLIAPRQKASNIPLHGIEPHSTTRLTLKVIEQRRQSPELLHTSSPRTMIHLLFMRRRTNVLVQRHQRAEAAVAQIAFVRGAVVAALCGVRRRGRGRGVRE